MSSQYLHSTLALGHVLCLALVDGPDPALKDKAEMCAELQEVLAHHTNGAAIPPAHISDEGTASIVFFHDPKEPLRCAIDIAEQLPDAVRIGIHTGPVRLVAQGTDSFVGDGIDHAQRIMELASAGNILVSDSVAAVLLASSEFQNKLHLCGDAELEPGRMVQLFSYNDDGGASQRNGYLDDLAAESELPGLIDNRYRVVEKLGQGGMGRVYLAEDTRLDRFIALKLLTPHRDSEVYRNRFYREARAASRLNHPHIATIYDYGTTPDGQQYIVMELVRGETLSYLVKRGPLRIDQAIKIVAEVADALGEAHRRGVIHRDIKPGNVVIDGSGKVKVLDFGLSKQVPIVDPDVATVDQDQSDLSRSGVILGTPLYLSPEQAKGEDVDARSDIFAIGSMLYECLTGVSPFVGGTVLEICSNVVHLEPQSPSKLNPLVPTELDQINLKALAKDPASRFQSADELRDQLVAVFTTLHHHARESTRLFSIPNFRMNSDWRVRVSSVRRPYVIAIAIAVLLLGALALWYALPRKTSEQESAALTMYLRGTQNLRDGAYFAARKTLEQAVRDNPRFPLAHARLAEAYMELDVTDLAAQEILRAEDGRQDLSDVDELRLSAIRATVQRDFAVAVKTYETLQQRVGAREGIYADLGRAYEKNYQMDKAIESYEKATQSNAEDGAAFVNLGRLYGRKREASKALAAFNSAEKLYEVTSNIEGQAEVLFQRGAFLYQTSNYPEAKANLERAFAVAKENKSQQVRILLPLSMVYCFTGETERSQKAAEDAVAIARANAMNVLTAQALVGLGSAHQCVGHNVEAEKYMTEGLALARHYDAPATEAKAVLALGSVQIGQGKYDEGLENVKLALSLYEKLGGYSDDPLNGQALIGRVSQIKGDFPAALKAFGDLLARANPEDYDHVAIAHEGLGSVKLLEEKYPEALAEFELSLRANQAKHDRLGEGFAYSNCGSVLWRLGRYDEARKMFDQALSIASGPTGYQNIQMEVRTNQLEEALSRHDFSLASRLAEQILSVNNPADPGWGVRATRAQALVALNNKRTGEARQLCDKAIARAIDLGDPVLIYRARSSLARVLLESQDAASALKTLTEDLNQLVGRDQKESLWQAYLLAASASQKLGDIDGARNYARQSVAVLASIEKSWGEQVYQRYVKRPDINSLLGQLQKLPA